MNFGLCHFISAFLETHDFTICVLLVDKVSNAPIVVSNVLCAIHSDIFIVLILNLRSSGVCVR